MPPFPRKMIIEHKIDRRNGPRQRINSNRIRSSSLNENENGISNSGWNSLAKAITHNNIDALYEILREPQVNINQEYSHGWTPLLIAVQKSNLTITEILLEHNANVDARNHAGVSALHEASRKNNYKMVQKLFDWRANPMVLDRFGRPPMSRNVEKINVLIDKERFKRKISNIFVTQKLPFIWDINRIILKYLQ
jgi:ankyrin repeat protein